MVAPDFRLSIGFFHHHKTKKLKRRLGADGVLALVSLWQYAAENRPNGDLAGLSAEDVELAADWSAGDPGDLTRVLSEVGFLDGEEGGWVIHDWADHNPWVASAPDRSDAARLSRLARENPDAAAHFRESGRRGITQEEYRSATSVVRAYNERSTSVVRASTNRSTPAPAPEPEPEPKDPPPNSPPQGGVSLDAPRARSSSRAKPQPSPEFERFWALYPRRVARDAAWQAWTRCLSGGHGQPPPGGAADLIGAAAAYARECRSEGREPRVTLHASTFLGPQRRWTDYVGAFGLGLAEDVAPLRQEVPEVGLPLRAGAASRDSPDPGGGGDPDAETRGLKARLAARQAAERGVACAGGT